MCIALLALQVLAAAPNTDPFAFSECAHHRRQQA